MTNQDESKENEMYVRIPGIKCDGCGETHAIGVQSPAYPHHTYTFECPLTKKTMYLQGLPGGGMYARTCQNLLPSDCVEAVQVT